MTVPYRVRSALKQCAIAIGVLAVVIAAVLLI